MDFVSVLKTLIAVRRDDQVVITQMSSAREWPKLSKHPLDFHYFPSAMGGSPPLGLGIALAQTQREVMVLTGDGSLLMNLGTLVTIAAAAPKNLTLVLIDNGVYEVTGGQPTAGSGAQVDFVQIAKGAGIEHSYHYDDLEQLKNGLETVLATPGPRFFWLTIEPERENFQLTPPGPIGPRLQAFRAAIAKPISGTK